MTHHVTREQWNRRNALRLGNGMLEAVVLSGGGHLAELRLSSGSNAGINCLWSAPWPTADPGTPEAATLTARYGADPAARFLAGYTGHALCLDLFGPPSPEEAARGVALHGEAAVRDWDLQPTSTGCIGRIDLPVARLRFERQLSLAPDAPVMLIEERVENCSPEPRDLQWVQHLTLGPPFLAANESLLSASLDRGLTWPLGYEGHQLLRDNAAFDWPQAPAIDGSTADLRTPFAYPGTGLVAATRVTAEREMAFIAALNFRLDLALVYCFRRQDFPWIAVWEENCARTTEPWHGTTQARGMEFGTTPMPLGRQAVRDMPSMLDAPTARILAAGKTAETRYVAAVANVPSDWRSIADVQLDAHGLRLYGEQFGACIEIPVDGISDFFRTGAPLP